MQTTTANLRHAIRFASAKIGGLFIFGVRRFAAAFVFR
jgi:hypothetical protein